MTNAVLLTTTDGDLGVVPASKAKLEAKKIANQTGKPVSVRDPITDKVKVTVKPT